MRFGLVEIVGPGIERKVEADVVSLDPARHLAVAKAWQPILALHKQDDAGWDWGELLREAAESEALQVGRYENYALECAGDLQALMQIELVAHQSRVDGGRIVYVEYLATAPSNRDDIQKPPRFRGCGSAMLAMALARSRDFGYPVRVGLHSKPGAEGFYRKKKLVDHGPDPAEGGFRYFESIPIA